MSYLFTSESVCAGHPDKICDQISDAVVDEALRIWPRSRVAVETMVTKGHVVMAGEVTCPSRIAYKKIAREVIRNLGYTREEWGFWEKSNIDVRIQRQSLDIAAGVDEGGAGDQGMMYGYACRQCEELMPLPIVLAHRLTKGMDELKKKHKFLRPDGKSQVTVEYEGRKPVSVKRVVLAVPHDPELSNSEIKEFLMSKLVNKILGRQGFEISKKDVVLNGTGKWEIGGPASDSGVTGRKLMVDTYGSWARHGGGCFSGKDATKVDRSGAYAARYVAKNLVAMGLCDECEVGIAYVIGRAEPLAVQIDTFGTGKKSEAVIRDAAFGVLSLRVPDILETLKLRRPIYKETASYGHFGRNGFSWERVVG